jgi:hypothetical protein
VKEVCCFRVGAAASERRRFLFPASTNCSVGQPLALGAHDGEIGAHPVINAKPDAVRVAEVELRQVAMQVRFGDVLIRPRKRPA